ncbi:MAG: acetyl/propionyl/methylcrotonyl-CoA carboxylase subunit alpha [Rhodospirillales bacterium]|nr:acetyl/propionyl/methylcrotonyl-CoA carboxylase subunit alpha [Rhodospirillales bacterium]MBO6786464.1 acetyl/propionyl/methylcrotonyl-CoA carboxylase subunit alpha [Rhodospirillales bacterium]
MVAIRKLLIANRGEIACRVMASAKAAGIATVAVYSDADANARHVRHADEAVRIGPGPAAESYLKADAVIAAALETGADAIHPGYGFLSENADFADAVAAAGLIFVGPPADAIRAMGSKSASKALMEKAGVPLVPGYHGAKQDTATLSKVAEKIGFPVLVKASAGGGGKGMRVVRKKADLKDAIEGAKREAKSSFGDPRLMIEKYLAKARHVEVQVFGDSHGNVVHLFERDCSLQRRHQKVIEEAPAPGMTPKLRAAMGEAAVNAARAVDYVGAGTVEFLLAGKDFYFIEMNTRLQVEHPVTEAITGQDLVAWQLRVAAGGTLPLAQDELAIDGHAFEARLYAEDPDKGYLPQTGTLSHLTFSHLPGVRIDTGIDQGDVVSVHYDPMIAKIIVHGADRADALSRLQAALAGTEIAGCETNLDFLLGISADEKFVSAKIDTGWLDRMKPPALGWRRVRPADETSLAVAALNVIRERGIAACRRAERSGDPYSPWFRTDGWRLIDRGHQDIFLRDMIDEASPHLVTAKARKDGGYDLTIGGERIHAQLSGDGSVVIDGVRTTASVAHLDDKLTVFTEDGRCILSLFDPADAAADETDTSGDLTAPMPGKVTHVHVKAGASVKRGASLLVLEAMKMEHTIAAPADGTVTEIRCKAGDQVEDGVPLVIFEPS